MQKSSENRDGRVQPVLRLEKERYVLAEAIRCWVGVMPKNSTIIPQELRKPCSLGVTEPDGAHRVASVGWPPDRMLLLVGIVATLLYVSMTHAHAEPFAYLLAHGLKIVGGAGGFAAQRRATVFRA